MKGNFWLKLKKPISALAPMYDVTDSAFRQVIARRGRPDIFFTWFVSCEGLQSAGRDKLLPDLYFDPSEQPIVAQVFGRDPNAFYKTGKLIKKLGFSGLDINLGCPEKNVLKQGSCAALIDNPKLAQELIAAAQDGSGLPVSVKTRLGVKANRVEDWLAELAAANPAAITLHGRLAKDMSRVPNDWEAIGRAAKIVKKINPKIIFLGNGDLDSVEEGRAKAKKYHLDGFMLGRAVFGNPWLFSKAKKSGLPSSEIIRTLYEHIELFNRLAPRKPFAVMKKHFKAYISGWDGAATLRAELMEADSAHEALLILNKNTL